ncbi:MAG: hypothetical protein IT267_01115 [Saprospiraceae bacterium]|nr:hypothetical protein [Saprospiraceae bacterium]
MKKRDWTDIIKDMENAKSPLVPDRIWKNVIPYLPQAKKNRRPVIFFFSGIIILGLFGTLYSISNQSPDSEIYKSTSNVYDNKLISSNSETQKSSATGSILSSLQVENDNLENSISSKHNKSKINNITHNKSDHPLSSELNGVESNENGRETHINSTIVEEKIQLDYLENQIELLDIKSDLPKLHLHSEGDCYEFRNKSKLKYSFELYAGPQFSTLSFSARSPEFENAKNQRAETETSNLSFLAGLRLGASLKGFHANAGLEFQNIYSQLNYLNGFDTIINNVIVNQVVVRTDTLYGRRTIKHHNYHRLLSIPVSIGYQIKVKEHALLFNIGASYNVFLNSTGAILNDTLRTVQFNDPLQLYKKSIGISPFLNVQWSGPIMHQLRYFVEPQFQMNPNFTLSSYGLKQSMNSAQVKLGLQYIF